MVNNSQFFPRVCSLNGRQQSVPPTVYAFSVVDNSRSPPSPVYMYMYTDSMVDSSQFPLCMMSQL